MTLDDLNNLDLEDLGSWPLPVKIAAMIILATGILGASYYYDITPLQQDLAKKEQQEVDKKADFEKKQQKAANLDALKLQMKEMEQSFGDLLRQLPNQTEVAGLLVDISQKGLGSGLEFELFKPGKEVPTEFYAELPIQIAVVGDYHQFGGFVSEVAALPRIVTTHNISITKAGDKGLLRMTATAKTYRALDDEETK